MLAFLVASCSFDEPPIKAAAMISANAVKASVLSLRTIMLISAKI